MIDWAADAKQWRANADRWQENALNLQEEADMLRKHLEIEYDKVEHTCSLGVELGKIVSGECSKCRIGDALVDSP